MTIPRAGGRYTLYAEGVVLNVANTETEAYVTLDDNFGIVLYYTVGKCRRLYVCCRADMAGCSPQKLSGCAVPLSVLCELTGRAYDRFKRGMRYLNDVTEGRFHRFPVAFLWQFAVLCQAGKNNRGNIAFLIHQYDTNLAIPRRSGGM